MKHLPVRPWNGFSRAAVAAPSLGSVQGWVGQGLEQPGMVEGVPAMQGVALAEL